MSIIVTIATFEQKDTAYFLKEKLEMESIDCYFSKTLGGDEIRVQVEDDDVERAIEVLMRIREEYGKDLEKIKPESPVRRIIVPTDFSISSEYACHYAIHLAHRIKGEIKILHVFDNPILNMGINESATYMEYVHITQVDAEKKAKAELMAFTRKMKAYMDTMEIRDVRVHSCMVMGSVLPGISGIADDYKPDFIVLGTVGSSGDSQSTFGLLADALIHGLNIPLYAIPGPVSLESFRKANVLYATDFNEKDNNSLECLLDILAPFEKKINCIHIDTAHSQAKSERMDELNEQLQQDYGQHDIQCMLIEDGDIFHGIREFAESNRINLISFTVHKRGIFEKLFRPNLFRKILKESNLPMLLFPS